MNNHVLWLLTAGVVSAWPDSDVAGIAPGSCAPGGAACPPIATYGTGRVSSVILAANQLYLGGIGNQSPMRVLGPT